MQYNKVKFWTVFLVSVVFLSVFSGCNSVKKPNKPNIILILADDLGYNELGCYGQEIIETPNIDKLVNEGMRFTEFYSGSPVCAPSRCALLTGQHPGHMYVRGNDEWSERGDVWSYKAMNADPNLEGQRPLPDTTFTIGKMLQQQGYKTAVVGKWGLGSPTSKSTPNDIGFDFFYGYNCQRQAHTYYPVHLWKNREKDTLNNKSVAPHQKLSEDVDPYDMESYTDFQLNDYAPELMLDETLQFMEENQDNPFFVYFATPIPHVALQAPQKWVDYYHEKLGDEKPYMGGAYFPCLYPRATYAAMISYLDEQVGEIVKKLKELGEYENTVIIFTSDNGPTYAGGADTKYFKSAFPFSEEHGRAKGSLYEGGLRVPLIVSWPGRVQPNSVSDHMSAFWDIMPSLAELAGTKEDLLSDGISILSEITGKPDGQANHDFLYWEYNGGQAVRKGKWKAIRKDAKDPVSEVFLFDLETDPGELEDVSSENEEIISEMKMIMNQSHQPCKDEWQQKWDLVPAVIDE